MKLSTAKYPQPNCLFALALFSIIGMSMAQAAPAPLSIKSAVYNKKSANLIVKTHIKDPGGLLTLIHGKGGVLGQTQKTEETFTIPLAQLGDIPCQVEARLGELKVSKAVAGAGAECSKVPTCKILPFVKNTKPELNKPFTFQAQVALKDKKAAPLTVEWDFAGGVLGHPYQKLLKADNKPILSGKVSHPATFIKDNSSYHVRFAASDNLGRRCEAGVYVDIGTPPVGLPPKVPEQAASKRGGELDGMVDDLVVLPFEDLTMQSSTDARLNANGQSSLVSYSTLNTLVYRKARLPALIEKGKAEVVYSAASNPADPAGAGSINSTSRNWPVGATLLDAQLQKTDRFDGSAFPDEGTNYLPHLPPVESDHGSFMPGIDSPYQANEPQPFSVFDTVLTGFKAWMLPLTDIDDVGRVNPYPLLRVKAKPNDNTTATATTDAVLTSGRDLHCRECHEKGGIAADPNTHMSVRYYQASLGSGPGTPTNEQPEFFEAASDRIDDRELAAYLNIASIHDFYDGVGLLGGGAHAGHGGGGEQLPACQSCHVQWQSLAAGSYGGANVQRNVYGGGYDVGLNSKSARFEGGRIGIVGYDDSSAIHSMHGQFIYNADKTAIRRQPNGRFERWHPEDGPNPSPLFPVKDASGKILPMEENCLKCHGGKREQCYRDRMFTAGVTCYQCHGDMLAVGGFYKLASPSPDGHQRHVPWFDEPECGACHRGNANLGKDAKNGFFSAGVMNTAFDESDPAATPRTPTDGPDGARFAVPRVSLVMDYGISQAVQTDQGVGKLESYSGRQFSSLQTPLFRLGKDTHGNVPCAACHGAAHAVWPNRDPNANDNVTALQLQGHTGTILECSVCHTADSFKNEADLDGSTLYSGDPKPGILGGPHNTHPINDPFWWKTAEGDTPNSDDTTYGGWHNNYAIKSGKDGEDQCAACHGNDHKGTRLSKTPVDRVFDFSGPEFNFTQLKKAGFKKKIIKVPAGSVIGCDTCHNIRTSCLNSPNPECGTTQGHIDQVNHAPVFTSTPVTEVTLGQEFHDTASASDPDGDPVTLSLAWTSWAPNLGTLVFDAASGTLTADWASKDAESGLGSSWTYTLTADDGQGHLTDQTVTVNLACPSGQIFDVSAYGCVKIKITSQPPVGGLDVSQIFTYPVTAVHADGLPLTYSLAEGAPAGMSINANGVITWSNSEIVEETSIYTEVIVRDAIGNEARQSVGFAVCVGSQHWNAFGYGCDSPIAISSQAPGDNGSYGMNVGETLVHHVVATHKQNLPLNFSLLDAPATMNIDPNSGHLEWTADAGSSGYYYLYLVVSDSQGGLIKQPFSLTVCAPPSHWSAYDYGCSVAASANSASASKITTNGQPVASLKQTMAKSSVQAYSARRVNVSAKKKALKR